MPDVLLWVAPFASCDSLLGKRSALAAGECPWRPPTSWLHSVPGAVAAGLVFPGARVRVRFVFSRLHFLVTEKC